jgi:uncharacterized protein
MGMGQLKKWHILVFIPLTVIGVSVLISRKSYAPGHIASEPKKEIASIVFEGNKITAEVVRTEADKQKGLGGRDDIGSEAGMLFAYQEPDEACFWMKDMRFAIDMIWIDGEKKVIAIKERVSPGTFPESFCPPQKAQYVLELPEGKSQELGLGIGLRLQF